MDWSRPALADALAAEYAAGTLRGPARRRFETLLGAHPALRRAVDEWQARLMPLTIAVAPEAPPARVWQALERRLFGAATASPQEALPWWQRLAPWRALTAVATVAAVAFALVVALPRDAAPPVVIVLQSTGADRALAASFVASVSADGGALVTRPVQPVALPRGRALELWSLPSSGGAPTSLGLIDANGVTVVGRGRLPATLLKGGTAALAVSVEPPGGSPTGAPTGPVVYTGKLTI